LSASTDRLPFPYADAVATARPVVVLDCVMTFFGSSANDAGSTPMSRIRRPRRIAPCGVRPSRSFPLISMLIFFGVFDP
jgi:hypothetical protein